MIKPMMWRFLALAATFAMGSISPASAQLVIGESAQPNVVIDWSVMDRLGEQPSLAEMLRPDLPGRQAARPAAPARNGHAANNATATRKPVTYTPYKAGSARNGTAAQPGKFVPYQPGGRATPSEAASSYQPGKFVPYNPQIGSAKNNAKVAASAAARPAKSAEKVVRAQPVAATSKNSHGAMPVLDEMKAEVKKAETARAEIPAPVVPSRPTAVTGDAVPMPKMPESASLRAVEESVKSVAASRSDNAPTALVPSAPVVPAVPAPVAASAPVAPAQVASAGPVVALPSIVTPPVVPASVVSEPVRPAAPPAALGWKGDTLVLPYDGDTSDLSPSTRSELNVLAARMAKQESLGLQLLAYAEGDDANASKARRLSLTRALEVRKYLMDQGVRSTRIEVRALGNKVEGGGSANRVEAQLVTR